MVENYQEMLSSEHSGFIRHNGICVVSVDEEKSVLTASSKTLFTFSRLQMMLPPL